MELDLSDDYFLNTYIENEENYLKEIDDCRLAKEILNADKFCIK